MIKNKSKTILIGIITIFIVMLLSSCSRQRYPQKHKPRRRNKNCGCPNFSQINKKIINSPTTYKLDHFDVFDV
ncbi:MAG: hypothetical protein ACOX4D_01935 [Bacteroidales bacterium]|jgi:hypothetical protein